MNTKVFSVLGVDIAKYAFVNVTLKLSHHPFLLLLLQISVRLNYYLFLKHTFPYHMIFLCYLHIIVILKIAMKFLMQQFSMPYFS